MKFYKIFIPLFMAVTLIIGIAQPVISASDSISEKVFRLHILANSDSAEDQQIKLKVRDFVLNFSSDMFSGEDLQENIEIAKENSDEIKNQIVNYLSGLGYKYSVDVSVCREYFDTRVYDDFTLPAGIYNSLKIELGRGEGHNWWCIIFPQVCLSSCTQPLNEYLSEEEMELVSGGYTPKFKIVEIYNRIKNKYSE